MLHPLRETEPGGPSWPPPLAGRAPPPMDHRIGGRKASQYSDAMARIILARVESGETVDRIVADPAMPSRRTLYDWIRDNPQFGAAWDQMRRDRAAHRRSEVARLSEGLRKWNAIHARAAGRRPRRKVGRKSTYKAERGLAVCALIAQGRTLRQATQEAGLANVAILYRWLRNHPSFRKVFVAAYEEREDRLAFEADMVAGEVNGGNFHRIKREVERLEGRIGALRPDIWRWD
jgi:transposase-like protein